MALKKEQLDTEALRAIIYIQKISLAHCMSVVSIQGVFSHSHHFTTFQRAGQRGESGEHIEILRITETADDPSPFLDPL